MGKGNRQRQLARQRAMRQAARREELRRRRRRQSLVSGGVVITVLAIVGAILLATAGGSSTKKPTAAAGASATPSASAGASASASPAAFDGKCTYTAKPTQADGGKKVGTPPTTSTVKGIVQAKFTTNRGPILVNMDADKAPCTVNALSYLISKKFYDGTKCTRVTTTAALKILQCGDPSGTGAGGPGFSYDDEALTGATYKKYTVAMANSGANTNGSQIFFVDGDSQLDPSYTPVGTIVGGGANLDKIVAAGTSSSTGDGPPKAEITLTNVVVTSPK